MNDKTLKGKRLIQILALTIAMTLSPPALSQEYVKQSSSRFCQPRTRCTDYEICYINQVAQPCAWGRGGANFSAIIFEHGIFYLDWLSEDNLEVTYGDRKQYKAKAIPRKEKGYIIYQLQDGVTVSHPWDFD